MLLNRINIPEHQIGKAGEHLVCADLIQRGHVAYLAGDGLPYDVLADIAGKLYKIQVKTTTKCRPIPQRKIHTPAYLFHINRCGKNGKKSYKEQDFDFMAFVALDKNIIGYLPNNQVKKILYVNENKLKTLSFEDLWK